MTVQSFSLVNKSVALGVAIIHDPSTYNIALRDSLRICCIRAFLKVSRIPPRCGFVVEVDRESLHHLVS
jgi:hypothetical protein